MKVLYKRSLKSVMGMAAFILFAGGSIVYGQLNVNASSPPDASAALQVTAGATPKGFLPPKVSLISATDATTIANPAEGLIVYNTNPSSTDANGVGLYINTGTPASPLWGRLETSSPFAGAVISKLVYTGVTPDPSKTVTSGNLVFRISATTIPQVALATPQNQVIYAGTNQQFAGDGYSYSNAQRTFTTANFSTFQDVVSSGMANYEMNIAHIVDVNTNAYYRTSFYQSGPAGGPYIWTIVIERF